MSVVSTWTVTKQFGRSVFMPAMAKDFRAACRVHHMECRIERGGGFRAIWFASAKGSKCDLLMFADELSLDLQPALDNHRLRQSMSDSEAIQRGLAPAVEQ